MLFGLPIKKPPELGAQMNGRPGSDDQFILEAHSLDLNPQTRSDGVESARDALSRMDGRKDPQEEMEAALSAMLAADRLSIITDLRATVEAAGRASPLLFPPV